MKKRFRNSIIKPTKLYKTSNLWYIYNIKVSKISLRDFLLHFCCTQIVIILLDWGFNNGKYNI